MLQFGTFCIVWAGVCQEVKYPFGESTGFAILPAMNTSGHTELLAPAGNMEKLELAVYYGADAVYLGGKDFSLRNFSGNFTLPQMREAVSFAHSRGVKVYVTCNIYARNSDQQRIAGYLEALGGIAPDAVIAADPAVIVMARRIIPHVPVHLSTQANTTNVTAARFWLQQGVRRINTARELTLAEIREIAEGCGAEIEAFVHGAMCISYSGRCLLSSYMARRHSNLGMCTHPCRWRYHLVEETRPGQYMPVAEDDRGTYIFNSRDLCMIEHIPEMIDAGIVSLKIEGRMKGINYLATVLNVYRRALDRYHADPAGYAPDPGWMTELCKISRRGYCTGFYFDDPHEVTPGYDAGIDAPDVVLVGRVLSTNTRNQTLVEVRNRFSRDDPIEILSPGRPPVPGRVTALFTESGQATDHARTGTIVAMPLNPPPPPFSLIRLTAPA